MDVKRKGNIRSIFTNKVDKLDEMDTFIGKHNLTNLAQEEIENMNYLNILTRN